MYVVSAHHSRSNNIIISEKKKMVGDAEISLSWCSLISFSNSIKTKLHHCNYNYM